MLACTPVIKHVDTIKALYHLWINFGLCLQLSPIFHNNQCDFDFLNVYRNTIKEIWLKKHPSHWLLGMLIHKGVNLTEGSDEASRIYLSVFGDRTYAQWRKANRKKSHTEIGSRYASKLVHLMLIKNSVEVETTSGTKKHHQRRGLMF